MRKVLFKILILLFLFSILLPYASAAVITERLENAILKKQNNLTVTTFGNDQFIEKSESKNASSSKRILSITLYRDGNSIDESLINFLKASGIKYNISESFLGIYIYPYQMSQEQMEELKDRIEKASGVSCADTSFPAQPMEIISEGRNAINATKFVLSGVDGKGVKIAILDEGFKGYKDLQKLGELPSNLEYKSFTEIPYVESFHGSACAEIIYDIVPAAKMYLLKVKQLPDIENALDYCLANGIKIVSCSMGFCEPHSFMAGLGTLDKKIDDNVANNKFLFVVAAGNDARRSWFGSFKKYGGTKYAKFPSGNNFLNVTVPTDAHITLMWNAYDLSSSRYHIEVYDQSGKYISSSTFINSGNTHGRAFRSYLYSPRSSNKLILKICQDSDNEMPEGREMRLIFFSDDTNNTRWEQQVDVIDNLIDRNPESSLCMPADALRALTVGAVNFTRYDLGPIEPYSSCGPTRGQVITRKPNILGPTGVTTMSTGAKGFSGTSAATPQVAGAAAILLGIDPSQSMIDLRDRVISNAQQIQNSPNNIYGNGKLVLNTNFIPPNDVGDFVCYPNPASISANGYVKITNIPFNTDLIDIQIYTVSGEFVKSFDARDLFEEEYSTSGQRRRMLIWDLRNQDGAHIAPGVYFVIVKTLLWGKQVKKIAVKI